MRNKEEILQLKENASKDTVALNMAAFSAVAACANHIIPMK